MTAEFLYIGEEEYLGISRPRPQVPEDQVWIFSRANEPFPVACIWGTENVEAPSAPWRFAMQIHKFYQSATFPWTFPLYDHFPLLLDITVTATLVDPFSYLQIARKRYSETAAQNTAQPVQFDIFFQQNQPIKDALQKELCNILAFESQHDPLAPQKQQQSTKQVAPLTLSTLKAENLGRLLSDGDLGLYIQHLQMIHRLGVRMQVTVRAADFPPAYKTVVKKVQRALDQDLLEARELVRRLDLQRNALPREQLLALGQKLYTQLGDHYARKRPRIEPILIKLIERSFPSTQRNTDFSLLAAMFFKDIAGLDIERPLQAISITTTRELLIQQVPVVALPVNKQEDIRNLQISELYESVNDLNSETQDWQFSPPDRNKVKEIILIDVGKNCTVEIQVPPTYPQERPTFKARKNKEPLPQKEVNRLAQPALTKPEGYDLVAIAKTIALGLNPRLSLDEPDVDADEQLDLLLLPENVSEQEPLMIPERAFELSELLTPPEPKADVQDTIETLEIDKGSTKSTARDREPQQKARRTARPIDPDTPDKL